MSSKPRGDVRGWACDAVLAYLLAAVLMLGLELVAGSASVPSVAAEQRWLAWLVGMLYALPLLRLWRRARSRRRIRESYLRH